MPAVAADYPSWDDVENARQDEAGTAAAIAEIETTPGAGRTSRSGERELVARFAHAGGGNVTSQYTYLSGLGRLVPVGQMVAGDMLFYSDGGTTWGTKYRNAIYIGSGQMIEAQYEGVPVKVANARYYDLVPYAARPTG